MFTKRRMAEEDGGVLVLVAIVMPLLLLLSAGGIAGFSLYASHRELQRAADQAALAGGASLPPADPNVLVENAPFPLPDTEPVYAFAEGASAQNLPRMRDLVPDPRAVACAIGLDALTSAESAALVTAFSEALIDPPIGDDGAPISTVCTDLRVHPRIQTNPDNTTPVECTNRLIEQVAEDAGPLDIDILDPGVLAPIESAVNALVKMPLDHVLPAAFTPRMRVTTYSKMRPPLVSLITGEDGGTMRASATAYRRIKNAVVVPILPAQRLLIDLGLADPIEIITAPTNLNLALDTAQKPLIDALANADDRLDGLMASQGLPCSHLLHNIRQDLRDIYDPPTGAAPTARDIVDAAVTAAERTADRIGEPAPDPSNPASLAGEAFVLIGVTVNNLMQPVAAAQIPILDVALVSMRRAADGSFQAASISAANAHGAFRATLVE